mmetsp:Transcript_4143/g.8867  ORF Transcript_4143/g.8867 Transcript_4143/m.8867 type:complete len:349 (-) Transcript_4143:105-1151(-)
MARNVPYYYAPTAPMAAPAVMTMPMRQIYVMPLTVVPPTPAPYTSFWPHFPAQPVNVPLARPVAPQFAPVAQPLAPGPPKMEHAHAPMVQWTTQPVVSAPSQMFRLPHQQAANVPLARPVVAATRSWVPFPQTQERAHASMANVPLARPVVAATTSWVPFPKTEDCPKPVEGPKPVDGVQTTTTTETVESAPRPTACAGLVGPNLEVPLQKGVEKLSAEEVHKLLEAGLCLLIDVRGDDRASGHIEGAVHEPTSTFFNRVPELVEKFSKEKLVIFHCQYSWHRGPQCANWYREQAPTSQRVGVLEGGFRGWERQRLPVVYEQAMDAIGQANADNYALSMGMQVAGTDA